MKKILLSITTIIVVMLGAVAPVMAEENPWSEESYSYTDDDSYITRQAELDEKMEEYCRENGKMTPNEIRSVANIGTIHSAVYTLFPFGVVLSLIGSTFGLAAHYLKVKKYRDEKTKGAFSNASNDSTSTGQQYKDATQDDVAMVIQLMKGAEDNDTFNQYHF